MNPTLLISIAAFVGVAALVGGIAMFLREKSDKGIEQRLDVLTGLSTASNVKENLLKGSVLSAPLNEKPGILEGLVARYHKLSLLFEQADTTLTISRFFGISAGLAVVGALASMVAGFPAPMTPLGALAMATLPLLWLMFRRGKRMKAFAVQLPDALELTARALRAGHSLASGFNLVREEMAPPISKEFGRVFEEQNLGISMDDSLSNMTERVPNLDLKFFATAIVLQRQTGGDLAEILDKIGYIIRERFKIWGQVQALTGEGRLSGVVLLGLPPVLFLAVYRLNPDYIMMLFTDPMGKKMLAGAVILQVLGALVIRKIINIKV
ncbi:MAG TPA: type II secretion system F family protein [Pirellulales bacterium]|nr:type II secretion system F family protein [Pirellulales bacterium]